MSPGWERHRPLAANPPIAGFLLGLLSLCLACGDSGGRRPEARIEEPAGVELSQRPESAAPIPAHISARHEDLASLVEGVITFTHERS